MPEASNNVVSLSKHGASRALSRGDKLLNECAELAATRLAEALSQVLKNAIQDLIKLADTPASLGVTQLYLEAMELARDQGTAIVSDFRQTFFHNFKRRMRHGKTPSAHAQTGMAVDISKLSLMEPDDLEASLAADNITNAIGNLCGEEMFGLGHRMGLLLHEAELGHEDNPVGPAAIGTAIMVALGARDCALKVRLMLVTCINKHLPTKVREVYQELNRHLQDKGVLPTIRVGAKKTAPSKEAPATEPIPAPDVHRAGQDLFAMLQQLMGRGGMGGGLGAAPILPAVAMPDVGAMPPATVAAPAIPPSGNAAATPAVAAIPVFMHTLTDLQRGRPEALGAAGLEAGQLADGQVNVLRQIQGSGAVSGIGHVDAMTLDIVALVFDYILDDRRVPDALKALIGRLQIPVLKVAMLDKSFFSVKSHPARKLLDVLAEAAMGWDEAEGHDSGLYRKVDELVQNVLNDFDDDVGFFANALEDLQNYLLEEKQRRDDLTARSAQLIHSREQAEHADQVAEDAVQTELLGKSVPAVIRAFLRDRWQQFLAHVHSQSGEGSETWRQALETMDKLVWSVLPKATAADRKQLVAGLPGLLKRLDDGLKVLDTPKETRDGFFAELVKCHAQAVKSGLQVVPDDSTAGAALEPAADEDSDAPIGMDFERIVAPIEQMEVAPALREEIAALPAFSQDSDAEEIVIKDVSWLAGGAPDEDRHMSTVRHLRRGAWIEFRQDDGQTTRAKLAWVSPLRGIYLFTNRLGERAMSINAEGLAAKFRDGLVQVIDDAPLVDRAVGTLLNNLQQTA